MIKHEQIIPLKALARQFIAYRPLLESVIRELKPARIEELEEPPGLHQRVFYTILETDILRIFFGTDIKPPTFTERVQIIFQGGDSREHIQNATAQIIYYLPENLRMGGVHRQKRESSISEEQEEYALAQKIKEISQEYETTKVQDASPLSATKVPRAGLIMNSITIVPVESTLIQKHLELIWLKALLMPCLRARTILLEYIEQFPQNSTDAPHVSRITRFEEADYHVFFACEDSRCQKFAHEWNILIHRDPPPSFAELFEYHLPLLKDWGLAL